MIVTCFVLRQFPFTGLLFIRHTFSWTLMCVNPETAQVFAYFAADDPVVVVAVAVAIAFAFAGAVCWCCLLVLLLLPKLVQKRGK